MRVVKLLVLFVIIFISCGKASIDTGIYYVGFSATLNSASAVPANSSTAKGTATALYNRNTGILTINVTWTGMTATAAHIHKGAAGVSGVIIFPFSGVTSPINYTTTVLDLSHEGDLLANLYYVDIHSTAYPNGEIRGQLIRQ